MPAEYYKTLPSKTVEQAIDADTFCLIKIKKELGEITLKALMTIAIADVVMFYNVGKTMNEQQLVQTVELLSDEFYYLKPSEIKYCFDKAKLGKYGNVYDRIDGAILAGWIYEYIKERDAVIETRNENKHKENKQNGVELLTFLSNNGLLDNVVKTVEPKQPLPTIERPKTDVDKLIQFYFTKFDKLHKHNAIVENNIETVFIRYKKQPTNAQTYAEKRIAAVKFLKPTPQQLIIWFAPVDKKIKTNQFHIEAIDNKTALEELRKELKYEVKVLGISHFLGKDFKNKTIK